MSGSSIIHVQISIANITTGVTSSVGVTGHEDDDNFCYILYLYPQGINKIKIMYKKWKCKIENTSFIGTGHSTKKKFLHASVFLIRS